MLDEKMVNCIIDDIKYKVVRYYEVGFEDKDLIILIPTRFFNILTEYLKKECMVFERPSDSTDAKSYIWGIETKRVDDLDDIYIGLK